MFRITGSIRGYWNIILTRKDQLSTVNGSILLYHKMHERKIMPIEEKFTKNVVLLFIYNHSG